MGAGDVWLVVDPTIRGASSRQLWDLGLNPRCFASLDALACALEAKQGARPSLVLLVGSERGRSAWLARRLDAGVPVRWVPDAAHIADAVRDELRRRMAPDDAPARPIPTGLGDPALLYDPQGGDPALRYDPDPPGSVYSDLIAWANGLPEIDLDLVSCEEAALAKLDARTAHRWRALPLSLDGGVLQVAVADPMRTWLIDALQQATCCQVALCVAREASLRQALDACYRRPDLDDDPIPASARAIVDPPTAHRLRVVPLALDGDVVTLAIDDPSGARREELEALVAPRALVIAAVAAAQLDRALARWYPLD